LDLEELFTAVERNVDKSDLQLQSLMKEEFLVDLMVLWIQAKRVFAKFIPRYCLLRTRLRCSSRYTRQ
jgi:hypothetical protein